MMDKDYEIQLLKLEIEKLQLANEFRKEREAITERQIKALQDKCDTLSQAILVLNFKGGI